MRKYKLKFLHSQLKYLNDSICIMFDKHVQDIDHIEFYNIKSFLKRLHDKIYSLSYLSATHSIYTISIDVNEFSAVKVLYCLCQESIETNVYLNILYVDFFTQINKQEIELIDRHKYTNAPTLLDIHKSNIDTFKNLEQ